MEISQPQLIRDSTTAYVDRSIQETAKYARRVLVRPPHLTYISYVGNVPMTPKWENVMHFDYTNYMNNLYGFWQYAVHTATSYWSFASRHYKWEDSVLTNIPASAYRLLTKRPAHLTELLFGNIIAVLCLVVIGLIICPILLLLNILVRGLLIFIPLPFVLFFSLTNNIRLCAPQEA